MRFLATLLFGCLALFVMRDARAYEPESGQWWYPSEPGIRYFIEIQDDRLTLVVAGGAPNGQAKWYVAEGALNGNARFEATLRSYKGIQPIGQPFTARPSVESNLGRVKIVFNPDNNWRARLTWPNGRSVPIRRFDNHFKRAEDTGGVTASTLKMLGEWQIVSDLSSNANASFPFTADVLVLDDYGFDNHPSLRTWVYEGCRPDDGQVGGCSTYALTNHDASGYYEAPSSDFPAGVQVIVLKDGLYDGRMWYALYELAIGTNDGSGWFTLYPQGADPYDYQAWPARAFRSASRTFVQEGTGPAKQGNKVPAFTRSMVAHLAAQGALPTPKASSRGRDDRVVERVARIRELEARLD
ncbi:hypothetical protein OS187_05555 [Xanthomonadaceae bacterium JHOS43]|nr:hypothetical protein [Xanthomonadaceae bacterium JHOS43]MCX7562399.1 hypothetical protein [Xanthomonadaceae bacterium XH05]